MYMLLTCYFELNCLQWPLQFFIWWSWWRE